jgi:hypothetical protein
MFLRSARGDTKTNNLKLLKVSILEMSAFKLTIVFFITEVSMKISLSFIFCKTVKTSNLMSLLSVVAFVPKGLFIDNIAKHMEIGE